MAVVMTPIYTQTASGSANGIAFNNIPQYYTDLKIVASVRSTSANIDALGLLFNGNYSGYTRTVILGNGSTATSNRASYRDIGSFNSTATTTNTFASFDIYIPNYTSSNYKQIIVDAVMENNAASTNVYQGMTAYLLSSTAAITRLELDSSGQGVPFAANSTFSLYGIIRYGA